MRFADMPIQRKMMMALLATGGATLFLACAGFLTYEILRVRKSMIGRQVVQADIIAANSTAALAFRNEYDASEVLAALEKSPRVEAACLYDHRGRLFVVYPQDASAQGFPEASGKTGYRNGFLEVFRPVVHEGRNLGTVYVRSNLSALTERYAAYAWLTGGILAVGLLAAYLLSRLMREQVTKPILALSGAAWAFTGDRSSWKRAEKFGNDELGALTDTFNRMLNRIQEQDLQGLKSRAEIEEKTRLLDSIMGSMSEGVVVSGPDGRMLYFNKSAERITGMGMSASAPSEWSKEYGVFREDRETVFPPEESPLVKAVRGEKTDGIVQFLRNAGNPKGIFVSVNGRPLRNEEGLLVGGMVVFRDITPELEVREALKASEANYREIFEKVNDALYVHDPQTGRILDVNQRTCELFECVREEILEGDPGMTIDGGPGYTMKDALRWIRKAAMEGPQVFEWKAKTKGGRPLWVEVSLKRARVAGQDRVLALVRDITKRKKLEEALKAREFVDSILENTPNMIFVKDAKDLRFVMFNKAGEELLGVPRADLMGKNDYDFFPKEQADFFTAKDRKVLEEGRLLDIPEEPLKTREKGTRILHTKKIPIQGADGKPLYLMGISEDITEQKKQEALRVYTKALETSNKEMQDFIFVASHDLQEPLRKIQAFGNFLKEELGPGLAGTAADYLARIQDASRRMGILIEDLLQLTRVTTRGRSFEPVDLSEVVRDVVSDLEVRIRDTKGRVEVGPLPTVEADATQMRQVFQNLIGNALKFHKPGRAPFIEVSAVADAGDGYHRVKVRDNGIGFDMKYAGKVFEIFQRLNGQEYEGTGIGLAVCRKVAERHGGRITVNSKQGEGTVFEVHLPMKNETKGGPNGA